MNASPNVCQVGIELTKSISPIAPSRTMTPKASSPDPPRKNRSGSRDVAPAAKRLGRVRAVTILLQGVGLNSAQARRHWPPSLRQAPGARSAGLPRVAVRDQGQIGEPLKVIVWRDASAFAWTSVGSGAKPRSFSIA